MTDTPLDESQGTWRVLEQTRPAARATPGGAVGGQTYPTRQAALDALDFAIKRMVGVTELVEDSRLGTRHVWTDGTTISYTVVWVSASKQARVGRAASATGGKTPV